MEGGHGPAWVRIPRSAESVADVVARNPRDLSRCWTVSAACTLTGRGDGCSPDVLVLLVADDLDSVTEQVHGSRYTTVFAASKSGSSGRRLHQLPRDPGCIETELVVNTSISMASSGRLR